jgi:hypothetical protein
MTKRKAKAAPRRKATRPPNDKALINHCVTYRGMKPTVDAACALDLLKALNDAYDCLHQEGWIADGVGLAIRGAGALEDFESTPLIRLAELHSDRLSEIRGKIALAAARGREKLIAAGALSSYPSAADGKVAS